MPARNANLMAKVRRKHNHRTPFGRVVEWRRGRGVERWGEIGDVVDSAD